MKNSNIICSECGNIVHVLSNQKCPICGHIDTDGNYIDPLMVPLIESIYSKGYKTSFCCSSHIRANCGYVDRTHIGSQPYFTFHPIKTGVSDIEINHDTTAYCDHIINAIKSNMKDKQIFTFSSNNPDFIFANALDSFNKLNDYCRTIDIVGNHKLILQWSIRLRYIIHKVNSEWYICPGIYIDVINEEYDCYDYFIDLVNIFKQIKYEIDNVLVNRSETDIIYDYNDELILFKLESNMQIDSIEEPNKVKLYTHDFENRQFNQEKVYLKNLG